MIGKVFYTVGQVILAAAIIGFVLYRLALLMDWVPEGFSPSSMLEEQYEIFKTDLKNDSTSDDLSGKISKTLYNLIHKFETRNDVADQAEAEEARIAAECGEASWLRDLMFWGKSEEERKGCIKLKHVDENPDATLKKQMQDALDAANGQPKNGN